MNLISWAQGKKTYMAIGAGFVLGLIHAANAEHYISWQEPVWVDWGLALLGSAALRNAVSTQTQKSAEDVATLINTMLAATQTPVVPTTVKIPSSGKVITIGQPSPPNQTDAEEREETSALNKGQLKSGG